MHTINIFLASSKELADERRAFELFVSRHGSTWLDTRNTRLRLQIWEDFFDAVSNTRKQDDYDKAIEGSQIFVMMFWTKVGKYTDEEFDVALANFKNTGFPLVYTYFKDVPGETGHEPSLQQFEAKLKSIGHFQTQFKSTEEFLLHFSMQLEKIYFKVTEASPPAGKSKAELLKMINKMEFPEVFDVLLEKFGPDNLSLNILINEFVNPPDNYSSMRFAQQLKVFITRNC